MICDAGRRGAARYGCRYAVYGATRSGLAWRAARCGATRRVVLRRGAYLRGVMCCDALCYGATMCGTACCGVGDMLRCDVALCDMHYDARAK